MITVKVITPAIAHSSLQVALSAPGGYLQPPRRRFRTCPSSLVALGGALDEDRTC